MYTVYFKYEGGPRISNTLFFNIANATMN